MSEISFDNFAVLKNQMEELANIVNKEIEFSIIIYPDNSYGGTRDHIKVMVGDKDTPYREGFILYSIIETIKYMEHYIQFCKRPKSKMMDYQIIKDENDAADQRPESQK